MADATNRPQRQEPQLPEPAQNVQYPVAPGPPPFGVSNPFAESGRALAKARISDNIAAFLSNRSEVIRICGEDMYENVRVSLLVLLSREKKNRKGITT